MEILGQLQTLYDKETVDNDLQFTDVIEISRLYEIETELANDVFRKKRYEPGAISIERMDKFFELHMEYALFKRIQKQDHAEALKHLAMANRYGFLCVHNGSLCCGRCDPPPYVSMPKGVLMYSLSVLLNEPSSAEIIGGHMLDSLNKKSCIIKRGQSNAALSWFVMQLFILSSNKTLTVHKMFLPKEFSPYSDVLEDWDSDDMAVVTKHVEILCDNHLAQAVISNATRERNEEEGRNDFTELCLVGLYLLPYEILVWFKLRQIKGLVNPAELDHPLMNTEVVKMFLDLKGPIALDKDVPFATECLSSLKQKFTDIQFKA